MYFVLLLHAHDRVLRRRRVLRREAFKWSVGGRGQGSARIVSAWPGAAAQWVTVFVPGPHCNACLAESCLCSVSCTCFVCVCAACVVFSVLCMY